MIRERFQDMFGKGNSLKTNEINLQKQAYFIDQLHAFWQYKGLTVRELTAMIDALLLED